MWQLGVVLAPLLLLLIGITVLWPAKSAVKNWFPNGSVKRLLLSTGDEHKVLFIVIIVLFYVGLFTAVHVMQSR